MRKITKSILFAIVIVATSLTLIQCKDAKDKVITKALEIQIDQINKQCPLSLGNGITMDSCSLEGVKTMKTDYTLAGDIPFDADAAKKAVVDAVKSTPDLKQARENEVVFIYLYRDTNGKVLSEINVSPSDYN